MDDTPSIGQSIRSALVKPCHLPNLISGLRLLLVPVVVWLLIEDYDTQALILALAMGLSDALDGLLAKRYGWISPLGQMLDPVADKLMLVSIYIALGWMHLLPVWLVGIIILREVIILPGALAYHLFVQRLEIQPSPVSKLNTVLQVVLVLLVILNQTVPMPGLLIQAVVFLTLMTTVISGCGYVIKWSGRTRHAWRRYTR